MGRKPILEWEKTRRDRHTKQFIKEDMPKIAKDIPNKDKKTAKIMIDLQAVQASEV